MLSWLGFGALPLARSEPEMNEMLRRICRRNFCTCSHRPWLFVGLGNPGDKYRGTRHNVGFEMLDAFADSQGIHMETVHCKAMFGKGLVNGIPVLLAKPLTYMNLSGESIGPLAAYYKLPLNRVIVFHDDMDLPCGVLRLHPKGGHNRHNGLKSVIYHFRGNGEFPRLRIGIGRPPGQMDPKAFMLQKFNLTARERISVPRGYYKSYRKLDFSGYKHKDSCKFTKINISAGKNLYAKTIDAALLEGAHALEQVVSKGFSESSNCFNTMQKYKHIRLQTLPA